MKRMLYVGLAGMVWISTLALGDEPAKEDIAEIAANTDASIEEKKIMEEYDKKTYTLEFEFPMCQEVYLRKLAENNEVLRSKLKSDPRGLARYDEMEHFYPSRALGKKMAPQIKEGDEAPLFFAGNTQIRRLVQTEAKSGDKSVNIADIKEGEFVLSTTEHLITDPRYHKVCWAAVHKVVNGTVKTAGEIAKFLYRGPANTRELLRATPKMCVFAKENPSDTKWKPLLCGNEELMPAMQLFTLHTDTTKEKRNSIFSELLLETPAAEEPVYSLHIEWTGSYFVGRKGAEILIRN